MSNKLKYAPSPPTNNKIHFIVGSSEIAKNKRGRKRTKKQYFTPDTDAAIKEYEDFITKQSEAIEVCSQRLNKVDDKGIFRSDDEIGFFFKEVQKIQDALNEFTLK